MRVEQEAGGSMESVQLDGLLCMESIALISGLIGVEFCV
jgi:hypothetical protein